jgi:ribosomal protein L30E
MYSCTHEEIQALDNKMIYIALNCPKKKKEEDIEYTFCTLFVIYIKK